MKKRVVTLILIVTFIFTMGFTFINHYKQKPICTLSKDREDEMSYAKTTWRNNDTPAINANNLNHLEQGVYDAHQEIDGVNNTVVSKVNILESLIAAPDVNYLDPNSAEIVTGFLDSDGSISTQGSYANYSTTGFIPINPGESYVFCNQNKNTGDGYSLHRMTILCYDAQKQMIVGSHINSVGSNIVINRANAYFVRLCTRTEHIKCTDSNNVYSAMYHGSMIPSSFVPFNNIQNVVNEVNKLQEVENIYSVKESSNLADSSNFITGAVQNSGSIDSSGAWGSYQTTDFIPLEQNKDYTVSIWYNDSLVTGRIIYLLYDSVYSPVSATYYNESSYNHVTFNSSTYKYVRISFAAVYDLMFSVGSTYDSYVDYYREYEITCLLGDKAKEQVESIAKGDALIVVKKSGNNLEVTSFVDEKVLKRQFKLTNDTSTNGVFNFGNVYYDNNKIKSCDDDIAPIRVATNSSGTSTVGANHGWAYAFKAAKGSLDASDIGSVWTDGTTQYTLLSVYNGYAYFIPPVTKTDNKIYCTAITPIADLTHVSGATHTSSILKSSLSLDQLYPSINKHIVELILDGKSITEDGAYNPVSCIVKESYGIMDLYELYTYARSHVGAVDYKNVTTLATINIAIDIQYNCEVIYTNLIADEDITLGNCGFVQADALIPVNGTLYRYINGVSDGVFDSESLVDMTNYNSNNYIYSIDVRQDQVPNRSVDLCINNGDLLYGFVVGYVPDYGDSADEKRILNSLLWDMRSTKKIYPVCIDTKMLASGEQINTIGYRAWFGAIANVSDKYAFNIAKKKYAIIDVHSSISDGFTVGNLGDDIKVVNNDGMTVGDFVNANGIPYKSSGNYAALVVKLY